MRERKQKNHLLLSIIAFVGLLMLIVTSQIYCRNTPEPTDPPILELTETPTTEQTESPTVNPTTEPPVTDLTETNPPSTGIPVTDPPKTGTEYDKNAKGRITFTVKVPEGFDEVVIVSLMDTNGGGPLFPVLPESNYVLVENLPSGSYYVSAYVENDPRMEYIVLRDCDEITVSQEQDAFMNFTVTGGPKEDTESTTAPTDLPVTEPPATDPPATEPTEPPHTHSYSETVIRPTCDEGGYTVHTCSCGKSYTDGETSSLGHNYIETVVEPTVSSEGYTEHTCSRCGTSYKDNYTEKLQEVTQPSTSNYHVPDRTCNSCHAWISGNVVEQRGELFMRYQCPHCGHVNEFPYTEGHVCSFLSTVFQPDCITTGYTWNKCSCGNYYTTDHKDKLGHDFSSGNTCSRCGCTEESLVILDYEDAMAYGNQYAADTYGWYIDLDLNFDNAGYNFPGSGSKAGIIERGGQPDLYRMVRKQIDYLYDSLIDRGLTGKAYFNCYVCEEDGLVLVYAFYG